MNPAFVPDQHLSVIELGKGTIVTSRLQETDEDLEKNDSGFEKLPDDGNRLGLLVLKVRERIAGIIDKQRVSEESMLNSVVRMIDSRRSESYVD